MMTLRSKLVMWALTIRSATESPRSVIFFDPFMDSEEGQALVE